MGANSNTNGNSKKLSQRPAQRVAHQTEDVWSIVNEAAAKSPVQPVVNMGQGFFGYNPPPFILEAATTALQRVDANQYSPSKGRPSLKRALAAHYSPSLGRTIDADTEVTVTTGANEGILSAFMAFVEDGDEVIVLEPFFDQYISNIEMAGGVVRYVSLRPPPPERAATKTTSAAEWTVDMDSLAQEASRPKARMLVLNSPHNPVGKVFSEEELLAIGQICVENDLLIVSDEVYDSLTYGPSFARMAALSPDLWNRTLTVGSAGKSFYATGWRVGFLIGPASLIRYVSAAHMRICYSSPSPLQEACATGYATASELGFWDQTKRDMQLKIALFAEVLDELGLPYTDPQGGYFVLVNFSRVQMPDDYPFPANIAKRPRDLRLSWFLIVEFGLAAIPPTEFCLPENAHLTENYLRFAICKEDSVLEEAKD